MGGNAFPRLKVPRLTPQEYDTVLEKCLETLQKFYKTVTLSPEAPGKKDYGDIDILVSETNSIVDKSFKSDVQSALKAVDVVQCGVTTSYAVPHPTLVECHSQIDLHLCKPGRVEWECFSSGYGDLLQIIGVMNRQLGLTMNDIGLHVRIPEIEDSNRKKSMVLLTSTVAEVCEFLGLDWAAWQNGFETEDAVFRFCAAGRFYGASLKVGDEETYDEKDVESDEQDTRNPEKPEKSSWIAALEININSNDRRRLKKRPMFNRFLREWAPANKDAFKNEYPVERCTVLEAAIDYFKVREAYESRMENWAELEREKEVLAQIKAVIPYEDEKLKEAMRGVKRWIAITDNGDFTVRAADSPADPTKLAWLWNLDKESLARLFHWVSGNYSTVRSMEKQRTKEIKKKNRVAVMSNVKDN